MPKPSCLKPAWKMDNRLDFQPLPDPKYFEYGIKKEISLKSPINVKNNQNHITINLITEHNAILTSADAVVIDEEWTQSQYGVNQYTKHIFDKKSLWLITKARIKTYKTPQLNEIQDTTPWENTVIIDTTAILNNNNSFNKKVNPACIVKQKDKKIYRCTHWSSKGPIRIIYKKDSPSGFKALIESKSEIFNLDNVETG